MLYGTALLPISLLPTAIGLAGGAYFYGALGLGLGFLGLVVRVALRRSPASCRALFLASVVYLPLVLGLLAWDRTPLG
jgi:protoheme IX farnesyltransferase